MMGPSTRNNDSTTIATPQRRRRLDQKVFREGMLKYPSSALGEVRKDDDDRVYAGDITNNATTTGPSTSSSLVNLISMRRATTAATSISTTATTTTTSSARTERWRSGASSPPTGEVLASGKNKYKVLTRSVRTALTGSAETRKRLESELEFRRMLIKSAPAGDGGGVGAADAAGEVQDSDGGMSSPPNGNYNYPADADIADITAGVSKRLLDIHQISTRLHRSFPWEGLGLHNGSSGHSFITARIGFSPATAPHTIVFSSFYIVPLILLLGVVVGLIWLLCACFYYSMKKIKFALCPGRSRSEDGGGGGGKKGKRSWGKSRASSNNNPCSLEEEKKPAILTPEMLEMRRQERLVFLHEECANLEQQLSGLRVSLPQQSSFDEKSGTLTSRASDSDLEYLGASEESPPLKRNSISLQDIPQSVLRIRREKQLRQIKEEIEILKTIAQQEKEKAAQVAKALKGGSFLITQDFELPPSKPGSPGESKVEPLSQHISHLKTQRKLTEIRGELEDLAIQLLHADEIKAKRNSLQELPRTAINIKREQNIISMTNEIQKMRNYKLQKICVIETALEKTNNSPKGGNPGKTGGKSFNSTNANPSKTEDSAAKYTDPEFSHRSSIRRQREQELNRVRVELKDLAYKLNLNPMNYISEDRVRLVPSQSMQSTSSASGAGQSSSYNKSSSSYAGLNHV